MEIVILGHFNGFSNSELTMNIHGNCLEPLTDENSFKTVVGCGKKDGKIYVFKKFEKLKKQKATKSKVGEKILNLKTAFEKLLKKIKRKLAKGYETSIGKVTSVEIDGKPIKVRGLELSYTSFDEATVLNEKQMKDLELFMKKRGYNKGWEKAKLKVNPEALKYIREKFIKRGKTLET